MKKIIYMMISIVMAAGCSQMEPFNPVGAEAESSEDILLAVENIYSINSISEKDAEYRIVFADVTPITVKTEHPDGIRETTLKKSEGEITEDGKNVRIEFRDGKSVNMKFDAWLSVSLSKDSISFDEEGNSETLSFEVEDTYPDTISVAVRGCEKYVSSEIVMSESGSHGQVVFSPSSSAYFSGEATVEISNGRKSRSFEVSLVREDFKLADGAVRKSFSFAEYERYFELEMHRSDTTVSVVIPDGCAEWVRAVVSNENVNGADRTTVCILLSENTGSRPREGRISIVKENYERTIPIDILQNGYDSEGSLRKGLVSLYNALHGEAWVNSENWCSDRPLFQWYGVSAALVASKAPFGLDGFAYFGTDDRWSISLSANNMRGTVPDAFWKACRYFEGIRISREYLPTSTVPDCVWHDGLYSLDLSMSFMNVPLSSSIARASNLHVLSLQACNVPGPLPQEFTRLSHLQEVNLRECGLSGVLPSSMGALRELKVCNLDHNMSLGGTLPDSFYDMVSLTDFDISATKIGGHLKPDITRLGNLEGFWITGCEFEGVIPEEFGQLDNLMGYDFDGNYFTCLPEFIRYYGYNSKYAKEWVGSAGFPVGVPYYQREKAGGRPENYIVVVPDCFEMDEIIVDGKPLKRPGYYVDFSRCRQLPFPMWARVRYGIWCWTMGRIDEMKYPKYPKADDLQYPGNEYYFDGKDWRHPKLEHPAREYWYDGSNWIHDVSCPWEKEYVEMKTD